MWFGRSPQERARDEARRAQAAAKSQAKEHARQQEREQDRARRAHEMAVLADERLTRANEIYERYTKDYAHYANVLILLGYGGFFALWTSVSQRMPPGMFGWAGFFMAISLLVFLLFEIAKVFWASAALNKADRMGLDNVRTLGYLDAQLHRIGKLWPWAFALALATGLIAGGILIWAYWNCALYNPGG